MAMRQRNTLELIESIEKKYANVFMKIQDIAFQNQLKVLKAFQDCRISTNHFAGTTGYGYGDVGRDALNVLFARVFGTESAIVSPLITGGTQALTIAMFAVLRPNDCLLSVSGAPYDTLNGVISKSGNGSLRDFGIKYDELPLNNDKLDIQKITEKLKERQDIKLILIQRSRGYSHRRALTVDEINKAISEIKSINPNVLVLVDNCYGEFVETEEPKADLLVGSLIKNPGGGLAMGGGYVAGSIACVELAANRLTAPSLGGEVGSYPLGYQSFYQGLFLAPHTVSQSLKGAVLLSGIFGEKGYCINPKPDENRSDIIQAIEFESAEKLIKFCRTVQYASPIDSFLTCEAWDMPGYDDKVIMAAGAFVSGASIELSCDAPIRPPYTAFLQGGLTYEHVRAAAVMLIEALDI